MIYHPRTKTGNVVVNGNSLLYNSKNNVIVVPEGKLAVIDGLEGYLVAAVGQCITHMQKR